MNIPANSSPANAATGGDIETWLPPEAPLAMPRQVLEHQGAADGILSALLRLIFTPLRG